MKKSRLAHIFSALDKKEIRDLRKWLLSPAHNQREDTVLLFEYLIKYDEKTAEEYLDKSKAFAAVFPAERAYDDAKMRQVMYFLLKSTEEFLVYTEFQKDKTQQKILFARVLSEKKLKKNFQKNVNDALKELENLPLRDKEYFKKKYDLLYEDYQYSSKERRTVNFDLQEISNSSDTYFLSLKLRQACIMASHQKVYKKEYDFGVLSSVLAFVEDKKLFKIPAIGIYYYGYKLIAEEGNEENFRNYKNLLFTHGDLFAKEETGEMYLIAVNYRIRNYNAGDEKILRELFDLYRRGFDSGVLLLENRITVYTFNNVVLIGMRLKEYSWAENFIDSYQKYLEQENRESTVFYCRARIAHDKGNYETAMQLFTKVEHNDILMTLSAKTFLLKLYYEQEEIKALDSLLDSMRTYLRRKKIVGYHKENYRNIIKYTKKLAHVNPYSKAEKNKLKSEIESVSPLTEKAWITEQLNKI